MSVHVEWASAAHTSVSVYHPDEFEDAYGSTNEKPALAMGTDSVFIIEGTKLELLTLLRVCMANVERWL